MPLSVIGVGYFRTATLSLKLALEGLGFGPCHHMSEMFKHPQRWETWIRATAGKQVNWDDLFDGYKSTTDAPGCFFFAPLLAWYPEAKFILTVRPSEEWYESASETVLNESLYMSRVSGTPVEHLLRRTFLDRYHGRHGDKDLMISAYEAHNADVRRTVPPERLLIHAPGDGWEPICRFLGVPVPQDPFPRANERAQWKSRMATALGQRGVA